MDDEVYSLELFIAKFLRYGVLVAGALMLFGWMSEISFKTDTFSHFATYHDVRLFPTLRALIETSRWGLLTAYAGMFVLISLPLLRVLMTLVVFLKKKDYALAAVSTLVLAGLFLSLLLGFEI
ncbi:hypothetical protein BH10BDE1_BH10BDE1_04490 [soil metagenome]